MITALQIGLVALAIADWWCVALLWRFVLRSPQVVFLRSELERAVVFTVGASCIGVLAAGILLGHPLGRQVNFILLTVGLLLMSLPLAFFLVSYYRGRFNGD